MLPARFVVSEEAAAAIRDTFEQEGELSAAIELRRLFPGVNGQRQGTGVRPGHRGVEIAAREEAGFEDDAARRTLNAAQSISHHACISGKLAKALSAKT